MRISQVPVALGLLSCGLLAPFAAQAQRVRIAVEPRVSALPGGAVWGRSTVSFGWTSSCAGCLAQRTEYARTTELERDAVTMPGGRITVAPAGGRWRFALDVAGGSGSLRKHTIEGSYWYDAQGVRHEGSGVESISEAPVSLLQLGVHAERLSRWRGVGIEVGSGLMAQQLHTRTQVTHWNNMLPGMMTFERHYRSFVDPAVQLGAAVGPARGFAAGFRVGLRSTHIWRDGDVANAYRPSSNERLDAKGRRWQWQPELALGWQVPVVRGSAPAR